MIIKNLRSERNLRKLADLCEHVKPTFILFTDDYLIVRQGKVTIDDYTYPQSISSFLLSSEHI